MEENKKSGGWDVRASKSPSEMSYRGQLHASERRSLKRSLEPAAAKAMSLGSVGGEPLTGGDSCGMKRTKSRYGGDVRADALSWV